MIFRKLWLLIWIWVPLLAQAQEPLRDPLLDQMVGTWVLRGTIAGQQTTHDVRFEWILAHQYLRFYEVSREKDEKGEPQYEAMVLLGWDAKTSQYACLWLDNTGGGGLAADRTIGYAKPGGDSLAFLFKFPSGELFHTTFAFDRASHSWQWLMDGEEGGKLQPFARVKLTRE
jgi:hypothetical protein